MTAVSAPASPTPASHGRADGRRFTRPGWRDLRLWLGVALLLGSMAIGAFVLGDRSESVVVLRAASDLSAGAAPRDLVPVTVPVALAATYAVPGEETATRLRFPVAAGDLLPRAALGPVGSLPTREVTVAVEMQHAPPGLTEGHLVDLWSTPAPASVSEQGAMPRLVLANVPVTGVFTDESGLQGASAVTLRVPADQVGHVVQAGRGAVIDLVAVPISAQGPGVGS